MNFTLEEKMIQKIAEKREKVPSSEQGILKKFSPSQKPLLIGIAIILGGGLLSLLLFSQPKPYRKSYSKREQQILVERFMPKDEVSSEYIDSLGDAQERSFAEAEVKKSPPALTKDSAFPNQTETKNVSASSMLLFSAKEGSNMVLPLGTEISAELEKTVIADDRSVPVVARLCQDVKNGTEIVFPRNSRVFGVTQGMVEDRVHVFFSRIVLPNGEEHPFSGIALDEQGVGGIQGTLKKKTLKRGRGILSSALLGASAIFAPAGNGFDESALRGAQQGSLRELSRDSQYYQRTEAMPLVTLRSATAFIIMIEQH